MKRRGGERPWAFVADWSRHCTRLELLLDEIVRGGACKHSLPRFLLARDSVLLPWHNKFMYPYAVPKVGRAAKSLFMKLLLYSMEFGGDRLSWMEPIGAKDQNASFFGIRGVRVPARDRAAFDTLCGVFPLTIGFAGTSSQRKTLDRNYKMMGLVNRCDPVTGDVFLDYDVSAKQMIRSQMERDDARSGLRIMARVALADAGDGDVYIIGGSCPVAASVAVEEKEEEDIVFIHKP